MTVKKPAPKPTAAAGHRPSARANPNRSRNPAGVLELALLFSILRCPTGAAIDRIARSRLTTSRKDLGLDGLLVLARSSTGRLSIVCADGVRADLALTLATTLSERRRGYVAETTVWTDLAVDPGPVKGVVATGALAILPLHTQPDGDIGMMLLLNRRPNSIPPASLAALAPVAESLAPVFAAELVGEDDARTIQNDPQAFVALLDRRLRRSTEQGLRLSLVLAEVDGLREVLAHTGADTGTAVVEAVAVSLRSLLRTTDSLGRIDGSRFAAILIDCSSAGALAVATKLRAEVARHGTELGVRVRLSAGAVTHGGGAIDAEALLERANSCLKLAIANGGDQTVAACLEPIE